MDRREALRKLGVGTAIAAVGPAVLPSFSVAAAASGGLGQTGLIGFPADGAPVPVDPVVDPANSWREVRFSFDPSAVTCVDGTLPEFSVRWRIASATFPPGKSRKRLRVTTVRSVLDPPLDPTFPAGTELVTMPYVQHSYGGGSYGASRAYTTDFMVRTMYSKDDKPNKRDDGPIYPSSTYELHAECRWYCSGAPTAAVAVYRLSGIGNGSPTVVNFTGYEESGV